MHRASLNRRSTSAQLSFASTPPPTLGDLDFRVNNGVARDALDLDDIGSALGEGRDAFAAFRALRRLNRDDASHGGAFPQRLADEQVHMGLQEAAGAELDDRERHAG